MGSVFNHWISLQLILSLTDWSASFLDKKGIAYI